ncbi:DUF6600 domain-containing protein [Paucibacter soli]|uniref:DUF6600 domain-containing protein n=1 Tax=Paucibacter soli TaxID=3133433 RepID=UPI00309C7F38
MESAIQTSPAKRWWQLVLALLLSLSLGCAWADPPGRVARVSELNGEAWLFDVESKEWLQLGRNHTISEGDRLRTDPGARMALRIGSSSLWVDERSDIEFSQLDDERIELRVDQGSLALRLRNAESAAETRLRTREGRFSFEREGFYRVDALDRGSRALSWQGRMRFESRDGGDARPVWLDANEQAEFWWANGPRAERQRLEVDAFTDWALARSRSDGEAISYRYVSPEMTGAEDLDRYGRWENAPDHGPVWIPVQVAPDWAPYRDGRWVWSRHWGWTWVDDAPWGFAPFHYGRWVHYRARWCWVPGRYVARPVYAPALVAWVGGGAVSVGISIGSRHDYPHYGWFPLAPREVYRPSYHHSPAYVQRLNPEADPVTVLNPNGSVNKPVYRNRDVVGAVSTLAPQPGGALRPAPWRDAQVPLRPVPQAPGRQELPPLPVANLPERRGPVFDAPRPTRESRPDRNAGEAPRSVIEREQQREQQREPVPRELPRREPERGIERSSPVPLMPQPVPQVLPQRELGAPRSAIEREQQREQQREQVREPVMREPARMPERMPERAIERAQERPQERQSERGLPMRSAQPMPPSAPPAARAEERPQRKAADEPPRRQDGRPQRNND